MAHALAVDYTVNTVNAVANITASGTDLAVSAGLSALSSVGVVGLTLSVINFLAASNIFQDVFKFGFTSVRIAVGLNAFEEMDADGDAPDVRLWTEDGHFTGIRNNIGYIKEGSFVDIDIRQIGRTTQQSPYVLFSANKNAICIAYAQQTWADGQNLAWVGNWGRTCDEEWYHSGIRMDGKSLECTWIDANGDKTTTGLQVHFPDFEDRGEGNNKDAEYFCNHGSTLGFRKEKDPTTVSYYIPSEKRSSPLKHSSTVRPRAEHVPARNNTRLIKSNLTTHTASSLCESRSSRGPDFVSLAEGQFCDMETKTLWPICARTEDQDCFDNDAHDVRLVGSVGKRDESVMASMKNYTRVTHWE